MNLPKFKPVFLYFVFFCCFAASAQVKTASDAFIQKATSTASYLLAQQPAEKVYLHLDKPYYAAGDDIWFKGYVTSGQEHKLSVLSGVLIVELLDEKGTMVRSIKLPLKYGLAAGDFHLPNTLATGGYQVRAYTNYMRNWGSEYFFTRPVNITGVTNGDASSGNQKKPSKVVQPATQSAKSGTIAAIADVQFFPESGSLVNGINSRVAFKATGPDGKGVVVKGVVLDNAGNEIAQFAAQHLGMGSFYLSPAAGIGYTAKLSFTDGSQTAVKLPIAANAGYVLSVSDNKNNPELRYGVAYSGAAANDSTLALIAQSAGYVCYIAKLKLSQNGTSAKISKDKLPTGITQLTLFRESGEPLAERLVFIDHHDQLKITLTDSDKVNSTHQLTTIKLNVKSGENKAFGSFSAAVIDNTKVPDNESAGRENILSYLLLSSELKGKVEAPADYFKSDSTAADPDLLMLTQGYRHFEWKQVLNNQLAPLSYRPQKGITVSGRLLSLLGKPLPGANVTLFDRQSGLLRDTVTGEHGDFAFENMLFTDSVNVLLTGKTKDERNRLQIKIDKVYNSAADMPVAANTKTPALTAVLQADSVPAVYRQLADEKFKKYPTNGAVVLKEVEINTTANKPKVSESSANLNGPGFADEILTSKDIEVLGGDLCQVLSSGKLLGVNLVNGKLISNRAGSRAMTIVLDGAYYSGDLCSITAFNVESIEILVNPGYTAIYGGRGGNGVAVITTKRGGGNYEPPGNVATFTIGGFYKAREFYSPKYGDSAVNIQLADLRSTIYWNPNIVTDKDGNASFNYYNAGAKGTYSVIVQGIDVNGKLGYQIFKYKVE